MVKSISGAMNTHIQQEVTTLARCWKIVRPDGSVAATGIFTGVTNFADGDTVTIGTRVYTMQATLTAGDGHVHIGALLSNSLTNLANAINDSGGTPGTDYNVTAADPNVTAVAASTTVTVTYRLLGVAGNSIATTTTSTHGSWGAATLTGGLNTTFRFTSHDVDLVIPGDGTYSSSAGFQNTAVESKSDLSVDNLDVVGIFDSDTISLQDLRAGLFDFSDIFIFMVNWSDLTQGAINIRRGKLGEVISSPQGWFNVELRGMTQLLQINFVELYGPDCRADLFDSRCGLIAANFQCTGHVTVVTDPTHITIHLDTTPSSPFFQSNDGWFQFGVLKWLTGQNAGRAIELKTWSHTANTLEFYVPTGYPVTIGDTFDVWPGCDKSLATCRDKFSNLVNMRAESYLPGNDQAFYYPDVGGGSG